MRERDVSSLLREELTKDPEVLLFRSGTGHGYGAGVREALDRFFAEEGARVPPGSARVWERYRVSWGHPGYPDLSGVGHKRPFYVETKSTTGRLEPHQRLLCSTLEQRGAFVAVVNDPGHAAEVLAALKAGEASFGLHPGRRRG